ncbi:hypothetical protein Tco_0177741, partial [Tanacetum coccineum]
MCDSDIDGFYNGGKLPGIVRVKSMTYFQDHKWYDELVDGKLKEETLALKAKELDYDVLTRPYANMKTEKTRDPYLDVNRIFGKELQSKQHRRFEMMKYLFNDDEEYITIKESEYLNHSKDSLDAYRELLHLIDEG